ncbi:MAG TPA: glutaredoxin, partial [Caldithrix abyssi]|nr:glutaredoxin [Caldithrix abyssi]
EILSSPGCTKCSQARERLKRLAKERFPGQLEWREVNIMEELDYAVELGVLSTPAIAVDGKLEFKGLPSLDTLQSFIQNRLLTGEQ